jgi:hypothetical protein
VFSRGCAHGHAPGAALRAWAAPRCYRARMEKVTLQRTETGWMVSGHGMTATFGDDLDNAACSALCFAELFGSGEPELGPDVPADALERGRRFRELLALRTNQPAATQRTRYHQD